MVIFEVFQILTSVIQNPLLNELEKKKSREQRILINYKEKKYQGTCFLIDGANDVFSL